MKLYLKCNGWAKVMVLLCLMVKGTLGFGQNESVADSLIQVYQSGNYDPALKLKILSGITVNLPDPERILAYSDTLMTEAIRQDSTIYVFNSHLQTGNALQQKGNLSGALESYFKAMEIANKSSDKNQLGIMYTAIAAVYAGMDNRKNVRQYYSDAIEIFKAEKDTLNYAVAMENLGDTYLEWSKPDSALLYFNRSGPIFKKLENNLALAYNLGNKGLAYAQKGRPTRAEENIKEAVSILEELGDYRPITTYLNYMSDIYANREDWDSAFDYALRSLELAKQYGLKVRISSAYLKLSELYERTGYASASLNYYRKYIAFRDSVVNITAVQQMADIRRNSEKAQFKAQLDLTNQQKRTQKVVAIATAIALFLIILLAIGLYRRNLYVKRTKTIIEKEMARSERLLINILPEETARELKEHGKVQAKKFESVSVLFTDFEAFTAHSEHVDPELLVNRLGYYFTAFDDIIEKYGLEKIKTIGDAYMCAGGLPFPSADHAVKMVQAAFEIIQFVEEAKSEKEKDFSFNVRIGINTGPVVAGVVGNKKFSYDIWGDTVNVASRMESLSQSGRINISENTYNLVRETFKCTYRGQIEVKNRGSMKMYFVNGPKQEAGKS
ncbi:guanylate cyclase [Sediminicola sp. YIK13]|uniref:adenylate/guanylate cyclase domain-containing protein n=1 Tax=Sediminicola sp. YIK13 TaxID=1453352 RepID=UPI000720F6BE|nr:adenylate/guanylate cyclase domain-containing protein [Sediminicola sp. YIK13]ALM08842.1 guanylate cyclase [Sediminicola sp. YIK13]